MMRIALGSDRAAKVEAVRASAARIAQLSESWREAEVIARNVSISAPAMPLTDEQLMLGARERALAVREALSLEGTSAQIYVGLEGGFHSVSLDKRWITFLRGWAYATNGERGSFGASPSIEVPEAIARRVINGRTELGPIMDEVAGEHDVRSRQGAWGVFSRDLLTRSESFEAALIAAFAPFYNEKFYT
jgi:inosine/xanthosine triphosphatase